MVNGHRNSSDAFERLCYSYICFVRFFFASFVIYEYIPSILITESMLFSLLAHSECNQIQFNARENTFFYLSICEWDQHKCRVWETVEHLMITYIIHILSYTGYHTIEQLSSNLFTKGIHMRMCARVRLHWSIEPKETGNYCIRNLFMVIYIPCNSPYITSHHPHSRNFFSIDCTMYHIFFVRLLLLLWAINPHKKWGLLKTSYSPFSSYFMWTCVCLRNGAYGRICF